MPLKGILPGDTVTLVYSSLEIRQYNYDTYVVLVLKVSLLMHLAYHANKAGHLL